MAGPGRQRLDVEQILGRIPPGPSELFRGVVAWPGDVAGWRRASRETLAETPGRVVRRTVWDHPEGPDRRLAVDVIECASVRGAVEALADRLEWNELATLPEGPRGLGIAAFAHPEGVPPAVFFVRANLCVSVVSFARRSTPVVPVAERLDRRLATPPAAAPPTLHLEATRRFRGMVTLAVRPSLSLVEDGYLRYEASGADLEVRDDDVVVIRRTPAPAQVQVFAIEPGREPLAGALVISLD
jgi:hypothetical protein